MIINWVTDQCKRKIKGDPYHHEVGVRRTLYLLFIPLFSLTRWRV